MPLVKNYINLFEKTLNLSGVCWWVIDYKKNPNYFYCNDLMKKTFSLNEDDDWHSVDDTCPIAGDYNKNIGLASSSKSKAEIIMNEYKQLLRKEIDEYHNHFPYYNEKLDKKFYFSSRAKVLDFTLAGEVSIVYGIIGDITVEEEQKKEIVKLLNIDKLTSIYNRNKLDESLSIEMSKVNRYDLDLSLIILDIDYFKSINDRYGHIVGDSVLVEFAQIVKENVRMIDIVGRWGGEEFMIICPNTSKDNVILLAEKLKEVISDFEFDGVGKVTASFGVTQYRKQEDIKDFLIRTDQALYFSKHNGRNRVSSL